MLLVGAVGWAATWLAAAPALAAGATVPAEAKLLVAHRAVYEIALDQAGSASGVAALDGRMVFEFTGNACEGFTQNLRFVMTITNREGSTTTSDMRSTTWENAEGGRFRFSVTNFENDKQSDVTTGDAVREADGGPIKVALDQPRKADLDFKGEPLFPVQHTMRVIGAALRGEHRFRADLYDGSDKGEKVFLTNTLIGNRIPAGDATGLEPIANVEKLAPIASWPVTIAYYETDGPEGDGQPVHEMSFRLYENGVIRRLLIDYGTLSIRGELKEIEFLPPSTCAP